MDRIGVGECQTHQVLWWQARVRNCIKEVEGNGGFLHSDRINSALVASIDEGKVSELFLDRSTGMVLLTWPAASGPRLPPRQHYHPHPHVQQQQQQQTQTQQQQLAAFPSPGKPPFAPDPYGGVARDAGGYGHPVTLNISDYGGGYVPSHMPPRDARGRMHGQPSAFPLAGVPAAGTPGGINAAMGDGAPLQPTPRQAPPFHFHGRGTAPKPSDQSKAFSPSAAHANPAFAAGVTAEGSQQTGRKIYQQVEGQPGSRFPTTGITPSARNASPREVPSEVIGLADARSPTSRDGFYLGQIKQPLGASRCQATMLASGPSPPPPAVQDRKASESDRDEGVGIASLCPPATATATATRMVTGVGPPSHQRTDPQQKVHDLAHKTNFGSGETKAGDQKRTTTADIGMATPPVLRGTPGDLQQSGGIEPCVSELKLEHEKISFFSSYLRQQLQQRQQNSQREVSEGSGCGEGAKDKARQPSNARLPEACDRSRLKEEERELDNPSHSEERVSQENTTLQRQRVSEQLAGAPSGAIPPRGGQRTLAEADENSKPHEAEQNTKLVSTARPKAFSIDTRLPPTPAEAGEEKREGASAGIGVVTSITTASGVEESTNTATAEKKGDAHSPQKPALSSIFCDVKRPPARNGEGNTTIEQSLAEGDSSAAAGGEQATRSNKAGQTCATLDDRGTRVGGEAATHLATHDDDGGDGEDGEDGDFESALGGDDVIGDDEHGASVFGDRASDGGAAATDFSAAAFTPYVAEQAAKMGGSGNVQDAGDGDDSGASPKAELFQAAMASTSDETSASTQAPPPTSPLIETVRAATDEDAAVAAAAAARKPSASPTVPPAVSATPSVASAAQSAVIAVAAVAPPTGKQGDAGASAATPPTQVTTSPAHAIASASAPVVASADAETRPIVAAAAPMVSSALSPSPGVSTASNPPTGPLSLSASLQAVEVQPGHENIAPGHGSAVRSVPESCIPAAAAAAAVSRSTGTLAAPAATPGPTTTAEFMVIRDEQSMADAIMAMEVGGKGKGGKAQGSGRLRSALKGTGLVALRLDERDLSMTNGDVSTIQIVGGTMPAVLVLDVKSLVETPEGRDMLGVELRDLLEDPKVCKVMQNVHDHTFALARLLRRQGQGTSPCIRSLMDLELAYESLGGDSSDTSSSALGSFGVCHPRRRTFSLDEESASLSTRPQPLDTETLMLAAKDAIRLRQRCKVARDALCKAGRFADVLQASQMKADFAIRARRSDWRRMTFVDVERGVTGNGNGTRTLASYELLKVKEMSGRLKEIAGQKSGAGKPITRQPGTFMAVKATSTGLPASGSIVPTQRKGDGGNTKVDRDTAEEKAYGCARGHGEVPNSDRKRGIDNDAPASKQGLGLLSPHEKQGHRKGEDGGDDGGVEKAKILFGTFHSGSSSCSGGGDGGGSGDASIVSPAGGDTRVDRWKLDGGCGSKSPVEGEDAGNTLACSDSARKVTGIKRVHWGGQHEASGVVEKSVHQERDSREQGHQHRQQGAARDDVASRDVVKMLQHLPKLFLKDVMAHSDVIAGLEEVVLDQGCRPRMLVKGRGTVYLCKDPAVRVTRYHLNCVVGKLEHLGLFEDNNTAGFDGLLHRVGVMRDKGGTINGATIRVGRYALGVSDMADDLLFNVIDAPGGRGSRPPCILVLGGHGAGKTDLVRDICRKLSPFENVVVVDTRNEIGGDGVIPHRDAMGEDTRRVMVPKDKEQHEIIAQAYRNHNPGTIVVDEIRSQEDVEVCLEIKARGVRVVAGAVGNLPSVLDSPDLGAALGGLEGVEWWENEEDRSASMKERRAGPPLFDAVIELDGGGDGGRPLRWTVVTNVGDVVDELLANGRVPRPEFRAPLGNDDLLHEVNGEDGKDGFEDRGFSIPFLLKHARDDSDSWLW